MFDDILIRRKPFPSATMLLNMNHRLLASLMLVFALTFSLSVQAEIYKWIDANGQVHFSDQKPAHLKLTPLTLKINTYQSVSYGKTDGNSGGKVVMYSTDWCGYCKQARKYFEQQSISFTEYDIEKNSRARAQYAKLGATGVPVILVGKKRMNGFSVKGFRKIYD